MKHFKKQITKHHTEHFYNIKYRCGHKDTLVTLYKISQAELNKIERNYCLRCRVEELMGE